MYYECELIFPSNFFFYNYNKTYFSFHGNSSLIMYNFIITLVDLCFLPLRGHPQLPSLLSPLQWSFGVGMEMDQLISNFTAFSLSLDPSSYIPSFVLFLVVFITISIAYLTFIEFKDKRRARIEDQFTFGFLYFSSTLQLLF